MSTVKSYTSFASVEGLMVWVEAIVPKGRNALTSDNVTMKGRIANACGVTDWQELDKSEVSYILKNQESLTKSAAIYMEMVK